MEELWIFCGICEVECPHQVLKSRTSSKRGFSFQGVVKCLECELTGPIDIKEEPTVEDFIKYGIKPELMGRFPHFTRTYNLTQKELIEILQRINISPIEEKRNLLKNKGYKLSIDKKVLEIIAKHSDPKTGARGLRSIIESILLKTMFKLPTMNDVEEVIVNENVIKNSREPVIIHSKAKKTSAA